MKETTAKYSRRAKTYKTRAEKFMAIDRLYKRVTALLNKTGLRGDSRAFQSFELAFHHMDVKERRKLLKAIFSPEGRDIKLDHEEHIELLETFSKKVIEGF